MGINASECIYNGHKVGRDLSGQVSLTIDVTCKGDCIENYIIKQTINPLEAELNKLYFALGCPVVKGVELLEGSPKKIRGIETSDINCENDEGTYVIAKKLQDSKTLNDYLMNYFRDNRQNKIPAYFKREFTKIAFYSYLLGENDFSLDNILVANGEDSELHLFKIDHEESLAFSKDTLVDTEEKAEDFLESLNKENAEDLYSFTNDTHESELEISKETAIEEEEKIYDFSIKEKIIAEKDLKRYINDKCNEKSHFTNGDAKEKHESFVEDFLISDVINDLNSEIKSKDVTEIQDVIGGIDRTISGLHDRDDYKNDTSLFGVENDLYRSLRNTSVSPSTPKKTKGGSSPLPELNSQVKLNISNVYLEKLGRLNSMADILNARLEEIRTGPVSFISD